MVSTRRSQALTCADSPSKASTSRSAPSSTERVKVVTPSLALNEKSRPGRPAKNVPPATPVLAAAVPVQIIAIPVEVVVAEPPAPKPLKSKPKIASKIAPTTAPKAVPRKPGRPKKGVVVLPKSDRTYKKRYIPKKAKKDEADAQRVEDLTTEPNVCKRCDLDNTIMIHFYQKHNGLLTEQENTMSIPEKRRFWSRTVKKGHKLHCLRPECGVAVASSTAMVYHAKTCGVTIEKKPCPHCQKLYSVVTLTQHINEHDRNKGEWKRKGKYLDGLIVKEPDSEGVSSTSHLSGLFGAAPHDADQMSSNRKKRKVSKIQENERHQQRHKRLSAIRAVERFQASDGEDEDSQESIDNLDGDSDDDDDTQLEEYDDEMEASTSKGRNNSRVKSTKFTSSANFPRLYTYWKRSLEALGYAKCEMNGCDVVTATLPEIVKHHKNCTKATWKKPGGIKRIRKKLRCHQCKYRTPTVTRMTRHYQNTHEMSYEDAEAKAKEKKITPGSWHLTQEEYDDLRLFD